MAPDVVLGLSPQVREGLHLAAWIEAMVEPSLMPVAGTGKSVAEIKQALAVATYRAALEPAFFPADEEPTGG